MSFQRDIEYREGIDRLKRMSLSEFVRTDSEAAFIRFITDINDAIVDNKFPLTGFIESVPLFVNADSFIATFDPATWVTGDTPAGTSLLVEFRTFNREDKRDAGEYQSISVESGATNVIDLPSGLSGPFVTDGTDLAVSDQGGGEYLISVTGASATGESVFWTQEVVSPLSTNTARYLSAEMTVGRTGRFLQWHVGHGEDFGLRGIGDAPEPFNYEIGISQESVPQVVLWDIADWPAGQTNFDYVRVLALKVLDSRTKFDLLLRNIRLVGIDDGTAAPSGPTAIPVEPKRFIQYRVSLTTQNTGTTPRAELVRFDVASKVALLPNERLRTDKFFVNPLVFPVRSGLDVDYSSAVATEPDTPAPPDPPPASTLNDDIGFFYEFDEASGTRSESIADSDDLAVVAEPVGSRDGGAEFTGAGAPAPPEILVGGDSARLSITGSDDPVTFSIYATIDADTGSEQWFAVKLNAGQSDYEYILGYDPAANTGSGAFFIEINGTSSTKLDSAFVPSTGVEYHVVAGHDPVADELFITINDGTVDTVAHTAGTKDLDGDMVVGNSPTTGNGTPVDGVLRKFAKWDKVLSSSEITELYNSGTPLSYPF